MNFLELSFYKFILRIYLIYNMDLSKRSYRKYNKIKKEIHILFYYIDLLNMIYIVFSNNIILSNSITPNLNLYPNPLKKYIVNIIMPIDPAFSKYHKVTGDIKMKMGDFTLCRGLDDLMLSPPQTIKFKSHTNQRRRICHP